MSTFDKLHPPFKNTNEVLDDALVIYCKWLNSFIPDEPDSHYRPIDFTDDRDNGHYGFVLCDMVVRQHCDFNDFYTFTVSTGDEGGPAILYVWVNNDKITHMVQLFDTTLANICATNGMTNELKFYTNEEL